MLRQIFHRLPEGRLSLLALGLALAPAACGKTTSTPDEGSGDGDGSVDGDGDGDVGGDGDGAPATGGETGSGGSGGVAAAGSGGASSQAPPAEGCPWVGYGTGVGLDVTNCMSGILHAHAVDACVGLDGEPSSSASVPEGQASMIAISGGCSSGAQEVQVRCCPDEGASALADTVTSAVNVFALSLHADGAADGDAIRDLAHDQCEEGGQVLSDWAIVYDEAAATPERIHYNCRDDPRVGVEERQVYQCSSQMFTINDTGGGDELVFDATLAWEGAEATFAWVQHTPFAEDPGASGNAAPDGVVSTTEIDIDFGQGTALLSALPGGREGVLGGTLTLQAETFVRDMPVEALDFVCWPEGVPAGYTYRPEDGTCRNEAGEEGREHVPLPMLRTTKDGECAHVLANPPTEMPPSSELQNLNEADVGYPELRGWNLAGADLGGTALYFAILLGADLRGANLTAFYGGYHNLTGTVDAYTTGLELLSCGEPVDDYVRCCTVGGSCE